MKTVAPKKVRTAPHPFVMIGCIVLFVFLLTFIIPSGEFLRIENPETGQVMVDPNSFQYIEKQYLGLFDLFTAVPTGLVNAANVMMFMFIICGVFQVITATEAIDAGVGALAKKMQRKGILTIPLFLIVFSIGGATFGLSNEIILYVPIGIVLARTLGYDAMTGFCMIALGAWIGYCTGWLNPFNVGVAQEIAELPLFSGIEMRLVFWAAFLVLTSWYLMRYAGKIKKDKTAGYVYEMETDTQTKIIDLNDLPKISGRQVIVLLLLIVTLVIIVYGTLTRDWFITEMGGLFICLGIAAGLAGGLGINRICDEFIEGAKSVTFGAILVGMAQVIISVVQSGEILDTIIYGLSSLIMALPAGISVLGMFFAQTVINFFMNSGMGQAVATMPIMIPIADINEISRQTAIAAFQFGDGLTNAIYPTSPVLMSALAVTGIPYAQYLKFFGKLFLIWCVLAAALLLLCTAVGY